MDQSTIHRRSKKTIQFYTISKFECLRNHCFLLHPFLIDKKSFSIVSISNSVTFLNSRNVTPRQYNAHNAIKECKKYKTRDKSYLTRLLKTLSCFQISRIHMNTMWLTLILWIRLGHGSSRQLASGSCWKSKFFLNDLQWLRRENTFPGPKKMSHTRMDW